MPATGEFTGLTTAQKNLVNLRQRKHKSGLIPKNVNYFQGYTAQKCSFGVHFAPKNERTLD